LVALVIIDNSVGFALKKSVWAAGKQADLLDQFHQWVNLKINEIYIKLECCCLSDWHPGIDEPS